MANSFSRPMKTNELSRAISFFSSPGFYRTDLFQKTLRLIRVGAGKPSALLKKEILDLCTLDEVKKESTFFMLSFIAFSNRIDFENEGHNFYNEVKFKQTCFELLISLGITRPQIVDAIRNEVFPGYFIFSNEILKEVIFDRSKRKVQLSNLRKFFGRQKYSPNSLANVFIEAALKLEKQKPKLNADQYLELREDLLSSARLIDSQSHPVKNSKLEEVIISLLPTEEVTDEERIEKFVYALKKNDYKFLRQHSPLRFNGDAIYFKIKRYFQNSFDLPPNIFINLLFNKFYDPESKNLAWVFVTIFESFSKRRKMNLISVFPSLEVFLQVARNSFSLLNLSFNEFMLMDIVGNDFPGEGSPNTKVFEMREWLTQEGPFISVDKTYINRPVFTELIIFARQKRKTLSSDKTIFLDLIRHYGEFSERNRKKEMEEQLVTFSRFTNKGANRKKQREIEHPEMIRRRKVELEGIFLDYLICLDSIPLDLEDVIGNEYLLDNLSNFIRRHKSVSSKNSNFESCVKNWIEVAITEDIRKFVTFNNM